MIPERFELLLNSYGIDPEDPQYKAESAMVELEEQIWRIGKPKGILRLYYRVFEWCFERLIYRGYR